MTRIVHIVGGSLNSGAGRGALWLHNELADFGYESSFLGRLNPKHYPGLDVEGFSIVELARVGIPAMALHLYQRYRHKNRLKTFKLTGHGFHVHSSESYRAADLIHIHWTTGATFSPAFWAQLQSETRPVVWTLRDMWPFTGGCHYTDGCDRFRQGCGSCPLLAGTPGETRTAREAQLKRDSLPPHIQFVAISDWLRQQAETSKVLGGRKAKVIHNAVPLDKFHALDKASARAKLGLPQDTFIAATGALHFSPRYKGAHILRSLIRHVPPNERFHLVLFGNDTEIIADSEMPSCHHLGLLSDDEHLNQVYAAADVFLMPSVQEAFGKATVEAMASGTPVIAFRDTGAQEIILPGETGWLAPNGNADVLAQCLHEAMNTSDETRAHMSKASALRANAEFGARQMARRYHALYQNMLQTDAR